MLRTIGIALLLALAPAYVGSALSHQCPQDMAAIDKALQTAQLSASDKQKVMDLRKQGEELHKAGNHPGSWRVLDQPKKDAEDLRLLFVGPRQSGHAFLANPDG